jgi:hypothetical protein
MTHPKSAASRAGASPGDAPDDARTTGQEAAVPGGRKLAAVPERKPPAVVERITVSLAPKGAADLQKTHERTRMSKTDIINRALSLYELIEGELTGGADVIIRRDGRDQYVKFL